MPFYRKYSSRTSQAELFFFIDMILTKKHKYTTRKDTFGSNRRPSLGECVPMCPKISTKRPCCVSKCHIVLLFWHEQCSLDIVMCKTLYRVSLSHQKTVTCHWQIPVLLPNYSMTRFQLILPVTNQKPPKGLAPFTTP